MRSETGGTIRRLITAFALLAVAFAAGWLASNRVRISSGEVEQVRGVASHGDAPEATRHEVLMRLRALRDGYLKRDVSAIDGYMTDLFPRTDSVQVFGADANEWNRGFDAVSKFIRNDWAKWGDVKLNAEDATVSAQGDTAWVALNGRVEFSSNKRPIRVTATLARINGKWMFEQVVFQWIDRRAGLSDLMHPGTLRLAH
jgi:hypothetical protein